MGLAVDPARESTDDDEPAGRKFAPASSRDLGAVARAGTRTDDGHRGLLEQIDRPRSAEKEPRRRIVDRSQQRRKCGIGASEPPKPALS